MNPLFAFYFVLPVILGVVILVMGALFLFIDSRRKKERGEIETQNWETTGGKIVSANINKHEDKSDDDKSDDESLDDN